MSWLIFVIIAVILDSTRIFIDNYASDVYFKGRGAASQKLFYGYAFLAVALILSIVTGFNFESEYALKFLLFFVAGFLGGIAGIPYYKALELDDSTNIGIFTQLAPVLYLIFGWFILDEAFSPHQLIAFFIIISAPLLIILTTRKRSRKVKIRAVFYAFLYVLIAVIGNIIFVKENTTELNFLIEMIFIFLGKGISDLLIVYTRPKWRKRFHTVLKESHGKVLRPLFINNIVGFVKDITYRLGLTLAPAMAVASAASDSVEPIVIFFLGLLFTLIWPKFGREKLTKKAVLVHFIAIILVVVGIVLIQSW
ncbi:EamA family transporter [Candidatus Saccharibacteria bacterium]|nr:EamA family transporter [Candidatus Saccharibacteria bacterium]